MGGKGSGNPNAKPPCNGRPKGSKNKISHDIKQMVVEAVNECGGKALFLEIRRESLARIAASSLIPKVIAGDPDAPITVVIKKLGDGK